MSDFNAWLGDSVGIPAAARAVLALNRIYDKPTTITLRSAEGTTRAAQMVRLDSDNSASAAESEAGVAPRLKVVILGVKDHPTVADTVIEEGDRFALDEDEYRVVDVIRSQIGQIEAIAEANG